MRRVLGLSLALLMVIAVAGSALAATKTLDFIWFSDGEEGRVMQSLIDRYEAENPDIEIRLIEVPYSELNQRLRTMVAGGEPPALARITDPIALKDALLDLTPYLDDPEEFVNQFKPATIPYIYTDGKVVGVPVDMTANGVFYNKTFFDMAGIEVPGPGDEPWTWEEWVEVLKTVVAKSPARYGMVFDFTPHRFSTLIYQAGGRIFDEEGNVSLNTPEVVRAVEFFVQLHREGLMPESVWLGSENPNTLFRAGIAAMHFSGNWMITNYRNEIQQFEWGVVPLPKDKIRSSVPGNKFVGSFANTKYPEEAAEFIKWFASQPINAEFSERSFFISARNDNLALNYEYGSEMFEIFGNDLNVTPAYAGTDWSNPNMPQVHPEIRAWVVEAIMGNVTPEEAAAKMQEAAEKAIASANR